MHVVAVLVGRGRDVESIGRIDHDVLLVLRVIAGRTISKSKRGVVHNRVVLRRGDGVVQADVAREGARRQRENNDWLAVCG
jgi:hypothetical protein